MKYLSILPLFFFSLCGLAQIPIYNYSPIKITKKIPTGLRNDRSAIIFLTKTTLENDVKVSSDWTDLVNKFNARIIQMGIDPVIYINHRNFVASNQILKSYKDKLYERGIKNLIFITELKSGYELIIVPFDKETLLSSKKNSYKIFGKKLNQMLTSFSWDLKRAEQPFANFLIVESPQLDNGVNIIEKQRLERYTGQLRRTKLVVEKFSKVDSPTNANNKLKERIQAYNSEIEVKNEKLEAIFKEIYPYEFELIDEMTDEEMMRKRYQFVIRKVQGTVKSVRKQLDYNISKDKLIKSHVPVMPNSYRNLNLSKNAIITKYYIRHNTAKYTYIGKWDADPSWENSLRNYINNMIQQFNKK